MKGSPQGLFRIKKKKRFKSNHVGNWESDRHGSGSGHDLLVRDEGRSIF